MDRSTHYQDEYQIKSDLCLLMLLEMCCCGDSERSGQRELTKAPYGKIDGNSSSSKRREHQRSFDSVDFDKEGRKVRRKMSVRHS